MKDLTTTLNSALSSGFEVSLRKERVSRLGSRFQAVGPFSRKGKPSPYDILEVFAELPSNAQQLFNRLKLDMTPLNFVAYRLAEEITQSQYNTYYRAITVLKKRDLIYQLKKEHWKQYNLNVDRTHRVFQINPEFIRSHRYAEARQIWSLLTQRKDA